LTIYNYWRFTIQCCHDDVMMMIIMMIVGGGRAKNSGILTHSLFLEAVQTYKGTPQNLKYFLILYNLTPVSNGSTTALQSAWLSSTAYESSSLSR
jgi:hypothetical protein